MKKIISTIAALVALQFYCEAQYTFPEAKPGNPSKHGFANKSLSNLIAPTSVNVSLLPGTNAAKNLGSSTKKWKNVYLSGGIFFDGSRFITNPGTNNTFVGASSGAPAVTGNENTGLGSSTLKSITSGYQNVAVGSDALFSNTTGFGNTANGVAALYSNTEGFHNNANGFQALYSNITGTGNTANGVYALLNNTVGSNNTAIGNAALYSNSVGVSNTSTGVISLYSNTAGSYNSAYGYQALNSNTTGNQNTASGYQALSSNTTGNFNSAYGTQALLSNTTGSYNTANGILSSYSNTSGIYNLSAGYASLNHNTVSSYNVALGSYALFNNIDGHSNTASGYSAMASNTHGIFNAAFGENSLNHNTTGHGNTAMGDVSLYNNIEGSNNTAIGIEASPNATNLFNTTAIGAFVIVTASNQVRIGDGSVTSIGGYTDWSNISDGRIKKNIKQNVPGLEFINKLKPVTYNLNLDAADRIMQTQTGKEKNRKISETDKEVLTARKAKEQIVYTGLVAQEVEKAAKELNYDFSGVDAAKNDKDLYGLRYSQFVVPLVKAVQELSAENEVLKSENEILKTRIDKIEQLLSIRSQSSAKLTNAYLAQNIPNPPLKNHTSIGYFVPAGTVKAYLIVTDMNGKKIKQVALSNYGKGAVIIETSALTPGVYFYSLIVDGTAIESKKMIVEK